MDNRRCGRAGKRPVPVVVELVPYCSMKELALVLPDVGDQPVHLASTDPPRPAERKG
jgi:hypothetical protein